MVANSNNNAIGLALLVPLIGALGVFLWCNAYPSRIFPGHNMTVVVGAVLGTAAIASKVEFWGARLFLPHLAEFLLRATSKVEAESWAERVDGDRLH